MVHELRLRSLELCVIPLLGAQKLPVRTHECGDLGPPHVPVAADHVICRKDPARFQRSLHIGKQSFQTGNVVQHMVRYDHVKCARYRGRIRVGDRDIEVLSDAGTR